MDNRISGSKSQPIASKKPAQAPAASSKGLAAPGARPSVTSDSYKPGTTSHALRLLGQVGDKVRDAVAYSNYQGHTGINRSPNYHTAENLWVTLGVQVLPSTDYRVAGDPWRKETSNAATASGTPISWVAAHGGLNPQFYYNSWKGGAGLSPNVGFSTTGDLDLAVIAPVAHTTNKPFENFTMKPPLSAADARALKPGTELTLTGSGSVALSAGLLAGAVVPLPGAFQMGYGYGGSAFVSDSASLALGVKRLDGDRVVVTLSKATSQTKGDEAHAFVGIDNYKWDQGNAVKRAGTRLVYREANAGVSAVHLDSSANSAIASYELDLSKPEAAQAYEAMLHLNFLPADQLASKGPDSGVTLADRHERTQATTDSTEAHIGTLEVFSSGSTSQVDSGSLTTPKGPMTWNRGTVDSNYSDLVTKFWKGSRTTAQEFVSAKLPGTAKPESYFHVRHEVDVKGWTSAAAVRNFLLLAKDLGVLDPAAAKKLADPKYLDSFGASSRVADLLVTEDGFKKLQESTPRQMEQAYAKAYLQLSGQSGQSQVPWLDTANPSYPAIKALLEKGTCSGISDMPCDNPVTDYSNLTGGRDLNTDTAAYKESQALVGFLSSLGAAKTPAERAKVLADARQNLDVDNENEMAMLAELLGPQNLKVQEMSLNDLSHSANSLILVKPTQTQDPASIAAAWQADPARGPQGPMRVLPSAS